MAVCPSCGSTRLRNGYRSAPFPLRLVGVRTLLCDSCNYEFRAFSPVAPKRHVSRRVARKADVFNLAPAIDLQALAPPGAARPAPAAINFDRNALPTNLPGTAIRVIEVDDCTTADLAGKAGGAVVAEAGNVEPADLREKIAEVPAGLPLEEPLIRLKEDLEERRSHSSSHACPRCGEREATRRHRKAWEKLVFGLTQVRPYLCPSCGHQFYARRGKQRRKRGVLSQKEAEFMKSSCFNQEREELVGGEQQREGQDG